MERGIRKRIGLVKKNREKAESFFRGGGEENKFEKKNKF